MNTESDITDISDIQIHVGGITKLINIIDSVRKKENTGKDSIHYLCCRELSHAFKHKNIAKIPLEKKSRGRLVKKTERTPTEKKRIMEISAIAEINTLIKNTRKNPQDETIKEVLQCHPRYQEIRNKWNPEKVKKLIQAKNTCLEYKGLGQRISDEKIEEIRRNDPAFIEVIQDFRFLFATVKKAKKEQPVTAGRNHTHTITIRSGHSRSIFFVDKQKHIDIVLAITSFTPLYIPHERLAHYQNDQYRKPENQEHE